MTKVPEWIRAAIEEREDGKVIRIIFGTIGLPPSGEIVCPPDEEWHHIAHVENDEGPPTFYLDGVEQEIAS